MRFIERYFPKNATEISARDIEKFVTKRIEENVTLDYKDIALLENPQKILKHICGFANAAGGLLIIGVRESKAQESQNSVKIYPEEITWGDGSFAKERLEHIIRAGIEPAPVFYILPVRKSKNTSHVIYLVDVEPSEQIHMIKEEKVFYIRKNFETVPISTAELISFVKERNGLQKCAYFRSKLELALIEFIDDSLGRLCPEFFRSRINPYVSDKNRKEVVSAFKELSSKDKHELFLRFVKLPVYNLAKFHIAFNMLVRDLEEVERYPHADLSAEEQDLFIELKDQILQCQDIFDIYQFIHSNLRDSEKKFTSSDLSMKELGAMSNQEVFFEEHLKIIISFMKSLTKAVIRMQEKIDELRDRYGSLIIKDYTKIDED